MTQFGKTVKNFIIELLISAYKINPAEGLKTIEAFSRKIFFSVRNVESLVQTKNSPRAKESKEYRKSVYNDFLCFVASISVFDDETLALIHHLLQIDFDFTPLAFLVSSELSNQAQSIRKDKVLKAFIRRSISERKKTNHIITEGFLEILAEYSSQTNVKFLLSDIGIELNLSSRLLMIRKEKGPWIPVEAAQQVCDKDGNLILQ